VTCGTRGRPVSAGPTECLKPSGVGNVGRAETRDLLELESSSATFATSRQTSGRAPRRSRDGEESREARHLVPGTRVGGVRAREVAASAGRDARDARRSPPRRCPPFRIAQRAPPAPRRAPRRRRGGWRARKDTHAREHAGGSPRDSNLASRGPRGLRRSR
jgi:hypothetical protein